MHRISTLALSSRSRLARSSTPTSRLLKIATTSTSFSSSSSSASTTPLYPSPSRAFSLTSPSLDSAPPSPPKRRSPTSPPKVAEKSSVSPTEPPVVPDYPSEVKPEKFIDLSNDSPRPSESEDPLVRAAVKEEPPKKESEMDPLEKEIRGIEEAEREVEDREMKARDEKAAQAIKAEEEGNKGEAASPSTADDATKKTDKDTTVESAEDVLDNFFDKPGSSSSSKPKRRSKTAAAADPVEGEEETPLGGKRKAAASEEDSEGGWFGQSGGKKDGKGKDGKKGKDGEEGTGGFLEDMTKPVPLIYLTAGGFILWQLIGPQGQGAGREINYQEFRNSLLAKGLVQKITIINHNRVVVTLNPSSTSSSSAYDTIDFDSPSSSSSSSSLPRPSPGSPASGQGAYHFTIGSPESFERQLLEAQNELGIPSSERIPVTYRNQTSWGDWAVSLGPTLLLIGFFAWSARKVGSGMGGGAGGQNPFNVGKSKAKMFNEETDIRVKFADVAGMDEAKVEIMEFVKFLKQPAKFLALGAKIPRGAILSGPPGTGKTLIAKATAGEAGVPFFSVSGSEFVEMFVGVGSSRVRDLFAKAKKAAPAIIFIDEIDAIGKKRGKGGNMGGNDERESTLNQLLVEMDGFGANEHIVVLAGTNRSDVLDNALMRPGRFDRHIAIDNPDVGGRRQIFMVHLKPLTIHPDLSRDVISEKLSLLTPGFSGADIANVCNEAALHCARRDGKAVEDVDFETAIERVIVGLERKSRVLGKDEKRTVAYHEAGHAVCGWFLEHADPLLKVSIIPRGVGALGYAQYLPKERFLYSTEQLMDRMCMTLGGRVSEEIFFSRITTGASDDLQKVTKMAFQICSTYGMNETIGPVSYQQDEGGFQKPFSEKTGQMLDDEVRKLVQTARERTRVLLTEKRAEVELVAQRLLEREVLTREAMVELLGKRPFDIQDDMDDFLTKYPKMKPVAGKKPAELTPPPLDDQPSAPSPIPVAFSPTVLPSSNGDRPPSSL